MWYIVVRVVGDNRDQSTSIHALTENEAECYWAKRGVAIGPFASQAIAEAYIVKPTK